MKKKIDINEIGFINIVNWVKVSFDKFVSRFVMVKENIRMLYGFLSIFGFFVIIV